MRWVFPVVFLLSFSMFSGCDSSSGGPQPGGTLDVTGWDSSNFGTNPLPGEDVQFSGGDSADSTEEDVSAEDASVEDVSAEDVSVEDVSVEDVSTGDVFVPDAAPSCSPDDCDDGDLCTVDTCNENQECVHAFVDCQDDDPCTELACDGNGGCEVVHTAAPCDWAGQWVLSDQNPVMTPTPSDGDQGADNIYAADIMWHEGRWWMWYGGQGGDGHDGIFLAWSKDLVTWQKYPSWSDPAPVVDHGGSSHVNDPSVVLVGGIFYMYYTEANVGENDRVYLATSGDGISWSKHGMVIDVGAPDSWEPDRVGRPAVLYEEGEFRMWYDGQIFAVARHVGYATSPDGYNWTKYEGNPVLLNEGAVDVDFVDGVYVLLAEGHTGTKQYISDDRLSWHGKGMVFQTSGDAWDTYGQVTPHLVVHQGEAKGIYVGGASDVCWCMNRIGVAFLNSDIAGCTQCLAGPPSCQAACEGNGATFGFCGAPGSTDVNACCSCCNDWSCN